MWMVAALIALGEVVVAGSFVRRMVRSENGLWLLGFSVNVHHIDIVLVELWAMRRG